MITVFRALSLALVFATFVIGAPETCGCKFRARRNAGGDTPWSGCTVKRTDGTLAIRQDCSQEHITSTGIILESGCVVKRVADGALVHLPRHECPVEQQRNRRRAPREIAARHLAEIDNDSEPDLDAMCLVRRDDGSLSLTSLSKREDCPSVSAKRMARQVVPVETYSVPDADLMCLIYLGDGSLSLRPQMDVKPEEPCTMVSRPLLI